MMAPLNLFLRLLFFQFIANTDTAFIGREFHRGGGGRSVASEKGPTGKHR